MNTINPEYQRWLDILSGLPGLGLAEQQAEILDRQKRGDLVQVNEVWYQRVDLSAEAAAAVRRAVQAQDEARPHDDEHAVDCHGCDGPGVVPCAADEVRDGVAYRDGEAIKDLRGDDRG